MQHLEYTRDGLNLVSCSPGAVKIWNPVSGAHIRTLQKYPEPVCGSLSVSSNSMVARVVSVNGVQTVQIWSFDGARCKTFLPETNFVTALAFPYSPTSNTVFVTSSMGLLMWLL